MAANKKAPGRNPEALDNANSWYSTSLRGRRAIAKAAHQYRLQQAQALIDLIEGNAENQGAQR